MSTARPSRRPAVPPIALVASTRTERFADGLFRASGLAPGPPGPRDELYQSSFSGNMRTTREPGSPR